MARRLLGAAALGVIAVLLAACGGDESEVDAEEGIADVSISTILAAPQDFDRVRVSGIGNPLGSAGFVLSDGGAEILVYSLPLPALRVDDGDRLTVIGRVGELEQDQIDTVIDEAERDGGERGTVDREALATVPLRPGEPYLELINVRDEGGNDAA